MFERFKWVQAALIVAICFSLELQAIATCPNVPGDVTADGETDVTDVQCAILSTLAILVGTPQPGCLPNGVEVADLNCDESASITDIQMVLGYALGLPLALTLDANGNNCIDACEPSPLCMFGANQTAVDMINATIIGSKRIRELLEKMKTEAASATCGTRNQADRSQLKQRFSDLVSITESVAKFTQFNNESLLIGDGSGNSKDLVLPLNQGTTTLTLTPKDPATLFGGQSLGLDTWTDAKNTLPVLNAAILLLDEEITALENDLDALILATGCSVTPSEPGTCNGLEASYLTPKSPFQNVCPGDHPESCVLEFLHASKAGINEIEAQLGELLVLTTNGVCGSKNAGDREALNEAFQVQKNEILTLINEITFNDVQILKGSNGGLGYSFEFLLGDIVGSSQVLEVSLPALGGNAWLESSMAINTLANAQATLTTLGLAFDQLDESRWALHSQTIAFSSLFGCEPPVLPPVVSSPSAIPALMAACETCTQETQELMNTAIAGYVQIQGILQSIQEAAETAADPATTQAERALLDTDVSSWLNEIDTIAATTTYNGIELLSGGPGGGGEFVIFHLGTRNTIHNQLAHSFFNQGTWNLFVTSPDVSTQAKAQAAASSAVWALMTIETDFQSLLSRDMIAHQKMPCELFIPDDRTSPGELCLLYETASGCDDCTLQNCQLVELAKSAYEAQQTSLNDMLNLAQEATNPDLDDYDRSYLDTHFQDLLSSLEQVSQVAEYNEYILLSDGENDALNLETLLNPFEAPAENVVVELLRSDSQSLMGNIWPGVYMLSAAETAILTVESGLDKVESSLELLLNSSAKFNCAP